MIKMAKKNKECTSQRETGKKRGFVMTVVDFLAPAIIVLILCTVVFALHVVPTASMEPTIRANSFVVGFRLPYILGDPTPKYNDVVSFYNPAQKRILIKRVIGLPGDKITFEDGYVIRNGEKLLEGNVAELASTFPIMQDEYEVPEGCVFVLGDNRLHSADSRAMDNPYINVKFLYSKMLFSFPLPAGVSDLYE